MWAKSLQYLINWSCRQQDLHYSNRRYWHHIYTYGKYRPHSQWVRPNSDAFYPLSIQTWPDECIYPDRNPAAPTRCLKMFSQITRIYQTTCPRASSYVYHLYTIFIIHIYQLHIAIWRLCGVCPICSKHMTWLYVSGVSIPTDFLHFWTVWGNSMQTKRAHSNSIQTDENWMCFPLAVLCPGWGISIWFYRLLDMISCRRFFTKIVRICSPSHLPDRTLILDISFQVACPMTMFFNVKC